MAPSQIAVAVRQVKVNQAILGQVRQVVAKVAQPNQSQNQQQAVKAISFNQKEFSKGLFQKLWSNPFFVLWGLGKC